MIHTAKEEDFEWIYQFLNEDKENRKLLGATHPAEIRKFIGRNEMLITPDHNAICEMYYSPRKQHIAIYKILVHKSVRRQGIANKFIDYIQNNFPYPIIATCKAATESELFWSRIGTKIEDKITYKGTKLSVYRIESNKKILTKEVLF